VKLFPNLNLAKRVALDIGCDDPQAVYRAMQRRYPGVLHVSMRFDELSRESYEDLCFAIQSEVARLTRGPLELHG
jgi:hypothetical protein